MATPKKKDPWNRADEGQLQKGERVTRSPLANRRGTSYTTGPAPKKGKPGKAKLKAR